MTHNTLAATRCGNLFITAMTRAGRAQLALRAATQRKRLRMARSACHDPATPGRGALEQQGKQLETNNIRALAAWTHALAYVTRETPVRLSVAQLSIFALAALGDRKGDPVTFTQLRDTLSGSPGGSVHTTYSIFFEQHKGERQLGWLRQERCYEDDRVKFLRLTPRGGEVLDAMLQHLMT